ncbi:MAG: endo-1,4-beta-xylanase [Clostridiales bacterium]|jgi:hypothetical protein|nr:endo-1,4-beta-xylanase [Clostridiales bacterium]
MAKNKAKKPRKVLKKLLITLIIIVTLFGGGAAALTGFINGIDDPMVRAQIWPIIRYVPFSLLSYPFKPKTNGAVSAAKTKAGGFIKGICHPDEDYELIKGAGIEWNRADIPYPFEKDAGGNRIVREEYTGWKAEMQEYAENGIKIFAVTPYPEDFLDFEGIDPRDPNSEKAIKEVAVFLIQDLKDVIEGLQITNELGVARFMYPLENTEQAVRFMGIQLEAVAPYKGDIITGYNSAGPQPDHHGAMKPYHKYCDYIGVDIYAGCFSGPSIMNRIEIYDFIPAFLWSFTGLPVIICEFGYIGGGMPKTEEERLEILRGYGYNSEAEAKADIENFVKKLPENFQNDIKKGANGDPAGYLFSDIMRNHLYRELPADVVLKNYPHTPEGQAKFYADMIPRLAKNPYIIGEFLYCWSDSDRCYVCGFEDCPTETRWGIVDRNGNPKPSYYAVRDAFGNIK